MSQLLPAGSIPGAGGAPAPVAPAVAPAAVLAALPGGFSTSEGKIVGGFIFGVGLLVAVFDVLVGTHALDTLPAWAVPAVDSAYATASAYLGAAYTQGRTAVKVAALTGTPPG